MHQASARLVCGSLTPASQKPRTTTHNSWTSAQPEQERCAAGPPQDPGSPPRLCPKSQWVPVVLIHQDDGNRLTFPIAGNVRMQVFVLRISCSRSTHLPSNLGQGLLPLGCRNGKVHCSK